MVGDDQILVEQQFLAEPVAGRAGALRGVEAEQARLDLGDGEAGDRAGEFLGEGDAAVGGVGGEHLALFRRFQRRGDAGAFAAPGVGRGVGRVEIGQPLGELQRGFEAVGQPRLDAFADDDAVDHHFEVMLVFLVERGGLVDVVKFAVDADAGEAGLLPFGELLAIFALAAADHRGEQIMARAFGQGHRRGRPSG